MRAARNDQNGQNAFSPELRLLMALVGQALGISAPASLPALTAMERLPDLASAHRVQPLVYQALNATSAIVPQAVMSRLKAEAQRCWIHSTMLAQELARISRLLAAEGIPMAAMKGPTLAAQVYGSVTARTMLDLDILVRASDFARVRSLLESNGFLWEESVAPLAPAYQEIYARQAHHFAFRHRRLGYPLEVHVRASSGPAYFPIPVDELLADAQPVDVLGSGVPALSPRHHFLFVAAHGAKHGWWRLQWVADFAAFSRRFPEGLSEPGLQPMLDSAFYLSHTCFGTAALGSPKAARSALTRYGLCSLARGRQPQSFREKAGLARHYLRLRGGVAYIRDLLGYYWKVTPDDFALFPLPGKWAVLYPALRPWLWLARKLWPNSRRCITQTSSQENIF